MARKRTTTQAFRISKQERKNLAKAAKDLGYATMSDLIRFRIADAISGRLKV